ncbi:hypothetical protein CLOP_g12935 [Closterium sp. NIES-67]|nr:hypothetical protein CLOP_g12935 [Closterium sp. NIES-67]
MRIRWLSRWARCAVGGYIGQYDVLILQTQATGRHQVQVAPILGEQYGDQIFNESRFVAAFEYGMAAVRDLSPTRAPITYFISARLG